MHAIAKDRLRFAVVGDGGLAAELEIQLRQDRFGGWEAIALMHARRRRLAASSDRATASWQRARWSPGCAAAIATRSLWPDAKP